jgi:hypothetical protein
VWPVVFGALIGAVFSFAGSYALRYVERRRERRADLYLTYVPAVTAALGSSSYSAQPEAVTTSTHALYREALVTSAFDMRHAKEIHLVVSLGIANAQTAAEREGDRGFHEPSSLYRAMTLDWQREAKELLNEYNRALARKLNRNA